LIISPNKLKIVTDNFANPIICQQLSQRIQSLIITHYYYDAPNLGIVSVRFLNSLVRLFSKNCQHLSLALTAHPNTVCPILRRMRQLHSLHIQWRFGSVDLDNPVPFWHHHHLQSTDPITADFVHSNDKRHLSLWFGNRF
jgi:hypothetical protein